MNYGTTPPEFKDLTQKEIRAYLFRELQQAPNADRIGRAVELAAWAANAMASPSDRITCCRLLARHAMYDGEFSTAHQWLRKARGLAGTNAKLLAEVEIAAATVLNAERRIDEAITRLESVRRTLHADTDAELLARALTNLASAYDDKGELMQADAVYTEVLRLREAIGDEPGLAVTYYNYAERCARRDDHGTAYDYFMRSYEIEKRRGLHQGLAQTTCQLALIEAIRGHADEAMRLANESVDLARSSGSTVIIAYCMANRCATYARLGMLEEERRELIDAIVFTEQYDLPHILGPLVGDYGDVLLKLGHVDESVAYFERALKISTDEGYAYGEATWHLGLGKARREQGLFEESRTHLLRAIRLFQDLSAHAKHLTAMFELAKTMHASGDSARGLSELLQWLERYHADQERRQVALLDTVHQRYECERQAQEAEIFRLRNVELTAAMQQLQTLNAELQELAAEKDEFLGVAAHDLRSPLGDMISSVSYALSIIRSDEPSRYDTVEDILRDVHSMTQRMLSTIYNFLEMSRTDTRGSHVNHEIIDLAEVVLETIRRHQPRAIEKRIDLRFPTSQSVWVSGDTAIVDAIVDNLLSNAIKYSPFDDVITLSIDRVDDAIFFRVRDHGSGIPESELPRLFTKYGRLSTTPTGGEESLGLGLYLASRLAKRINAEVRCEQTGPTGTTFVVQLQPAVPTVPR